MPATCRADYAILEARTAATLMGLSVGPPLSPTASPIQSTARIFSNVLRTELPNLAALCVTPTAFWVAHFAQLTFVQNAEYARRPEIFRCAH